MQQNRGLCLLAQSCCTLTWCCQCELQTDIIISYSAGLKCRSRIRICHSSPLWWPFFFFFFSLHVVLWPNYPALVHFWLDTTAVTPPPHLLSAVSCRLSEVSSHFNLFCSEAWKKVWPLRRTLDAPWSVFAALRWRAGVEITKKGEKKKNTAEEKQ